MENYPKILLIDVSAALIAGLIVLFAHELISLLYGLPVSTVLIIAVGNLTYSIYGLVLAKTPSRKLVAIQVLALGNAIWGVFCVVLVLLNAKQITLVGVTIVSLEAAFVFILAVLEWRWRYQISTH